MRRPKKYESGEATQYITRRAALRKLQLSLNDFRRLCIIKGVYPREPKHRRRAQKGASDIRILYHAKDIRFLLHEPIVWTLRDYKIFAKKTGRDRAIKDFRNLKRRLERFPELKIDHIVKERYPTFIDAIKDLDDCLTLLFLFSTFPSLRLIPREQSCLCRRLTIEFLHYIIASKSLRYVFISIKGYYFQADIKGQKVTWIVPHYYPFKPHSKDEVDFKVMSIFVEFYTIVLGFVNFRLYHSINLAYPPQFPTTVLTESKETLSNEAAFVSDRIAALNFEIMRTDNFAQEEEHDDIELDAELLIGDDDSKRMMKMKKEAQEVRRLKTLFKGFKFFINREVPREPLVILIRSFGGKVSWDSTVFPGATFDETDESITHQIVDRNELSNRYISRDYVQPQWVFDCVNKRQLLPTNKYFMGVILPPHLSPFVEYKYDPHVAPSSGNGQEDEEVEEDDCLTEKSSEQEDDDNNEHENNDTNKNDDAVNSELASNLLDAQLEKAFQDEEADMKSFTNEKEINETERQRLKEKNNMSVQSGKVHKENKRLLRKSQIDEHRLQARMVKPRHRNLFRKLIRDKQAKEKEEWLLKKKRRLIESQQKQLKKNGKSIKQ